VCVLSRSEGAASTALSTASYFSESERCAALMCYKNFENPFDFDLQEEINLKVPKSHFFLGLQQFANLSFFQLIKLPQYAIIF